LEKYNAANGKVRVALAAAGFEPKHATVHVKRAAQPRYAPCLLLPTEDWESGNLSKKIRLLPLYNLLIFAKTSDGVCARGQRQNRPALLLKRYLA
jgi:hypothetical protein